MKKQYSACNKATACFLSLLIAMASTVGSVPVAFADEGTALTVNGRSATVSGFSFDGAATAAYGEVLTLSLSGGTASSYVVLDAAGADTAKLDEATWQPITSGQRLALTPGHDYFIGYSATVDGVVVDSLTGEYGMTVVKGTLASPGGLSWLGATARWSAVTASSGGAALDEGAVGGFTVTLYKGDTLLETQTAAADAVSFDFSDAIADKGAGTYSFTVRADVSSALSGLYNSSDASSAVSVRAVRVELSAGSGIASVSPASSLVMAGGTLEISASPASGRTFERWACGQSGVSFDNASLAETGLTVASDYAGPDAVAVSASTVDSFLPVISAFSAGSGAQLSASASDADTGIAAYSFSAEAEAAKAAWVTADVAAGVSQTFTCDLTAGGVYYFHVKDKAGNTATGGPLSVTQVRYHGYYADSAAAALTEYLIGSGPLTLKIPVRAGFVSSGWHLNAPTGSVVTALSAHDTANGVDVYTSWTREQVSFSASPADLSFTYDGAARRLSAALKNATGAITWQWYKDGVAIPGATSSSYPVKTVADSGSYYVVAAVTAEGETMTAQSAAAAVTVTPAVLTVTPEDKTVVFRGAAPAYTYTCTGYAAGEDADDITPGTVTCAYVQGDVAGTYSIAAAGFSADNYTFSYPKFGVLKVTALPIDGVANVSISLSGTSFPYTGSAIEPAVTVTENGAAMDPLDYSVGYAGNTDAGTAVVTVTFRRNFSGAITENFTITAADVASMVELSGWTYGDAAPAPSLTANPSGGEVVWYYRAAGAGRTDSVTAQPTNAGEYLVYATVAATSNYHAITTADTAFSIAKRPIALTAASGAWVYDGSAHSNASYEQVGSFAGTDGFHSVSVAGSITDVGETANVVSYVLTSSTRAENYAITPVNGTLTVSLKPLTVPANFRWDADAPGTASWAAVSRENLTVDYELELYRVSGADRVLVATEVTAGTLYSFADAIKANCAENGAPGAYCCTIMTRPAGGDAKNNYQASDVSPESAALSTAHLTVSGDAGTSSALLGEETDVYLLAGETLRAAATLRDGYSFKAWSCADANVTLSAAASAETGVTLSASLSSPVDHVSLQASTADDLPVIAEYSAANSAGLQKVTLRLRASDAVGVTAWALTHSAQQPAADAADWNALDPAQTSLDLSSDALESGAYYVWVRDAGGNVVGADPIHVYSVTFASGGGQGAMSGILKAQNTGVKLPAEVFTRDGMAFSGWSGATGLYSDEGVYAANADDTLTAQWTDDEFTYTVRYFYMLTDGSYAAAPDATKDYIAAYGVTVTSISAHIQSAMTGMSLDPAKARSVTVTGNGQTLDVFYQRDLHTITYTYRLPGAAADTTVVKSFRYGAAITEAEKPAKDGYTFVGWVYGEAGSVPSAMPAADIHASGTFNPVAATYTVVCYLKGLDGAYVLDPTLTQEKNAYHDESLTLTPADAPAVSGFTAAGVATSVNAVAGADPQSLSDTAQGTVSAIDGQKLFVSYYYTRNSYTLTLNVWQGLRDTEGNLKYTYAWTIPYGTVLTSTDYSDYEKDTWPHSEGYVLASYSDWSTGSAPTSMPAGDVAVARDFISDTESAYYVEIYYEDVTAGKYTLQTSLMYYAGIGAHVTLGGDDTTTVNYNSFSGYLPDFAFYQFSTDNAANVLSATVSDVNVGETPAVLKAYFDRRTVTATVNYYYNNGSSSAATLITTETKTGRWGETYTLKPFAYFNGQSPALIDFLTSNYIVSYTGRYYLDGWHWPNAKLTTLATLNREDTISFGQNNVDGHYLNYVNVYYTKAEPATQYTLAVWYRPSGLDATKNQPDRRLTATVNGTTYNVCVANRAYVFKATPSSAAGYETYPGAGILNGSWLEDGTLNEGFSAVTDDTGTYYVKDGNLYVLDATNQFIKGNRVSYSYASTSPGYSQVTDFLSSYKTDSTYNSDASRAGAYISSAFYGAIMYGDGDLIITFDYKAMDTLWHTLGGNTCAGHTYVDDSSVTSLDCALDAYPEKAGYSIVWYRDYGFTTPATVPFTITENVTLYGRYEKNTVQGVDYVYYQLADPVTIDGASVDYITEANRSATEISGKMTSVTENGATKWSCDGTLVMIETLHPTQTYMAISLTTGGYALAGYHYDDTNTGNTLLGYCETSPLYLRAYFARDLYTLTLDPNNSTVSNTETTSRRTGGTVAVQPPTQDGYTFAGWSWTKWDASANAGAGAYVAWADGPTGVGEVSFTMPAMDLKATARWTPASFPQTVTHYFRTAGGVYDTALLEKLQAATGAAGSVSFDGKTYSGLIYSDGGAIIGASFVATDGRTLWFSCSASTVDRSQLIAVTETKTYTSEQVVEVNSLIIETDDKYSYALTLYQDGSEVDTLRKEDHFTCVYGMTLTYYYTRESFAVRAAVRASDGLAVGGTVTGTGSFVFGDTATLRYAPSNGYTFVGWYAASDVLQDYAAGADLTQALSADYASKTKLSGELVYTFSVMGATDAVAVVAAAAADVPTVAIDGGEGASEGKKTLTYGYSVATGDLLTMQVTLPEDASSATAVSGYQWYLGGVALDGATSAAYVIPTGKEVEEYSYTCMVTMTRKDNGRQATATTDSFVLKVVPAEIASTAEAYSGAYDGAGHSIAVRVTAPDSASQYAIYYAETALTKDNYTTAGSAADLAYTDVRLVDGSPAAYPVYYYIHSLNPNYSDVAGSSTVLITPAVLTLSAGSSAFFKTYDGTAAVSGSATASGTDLYALAHDGYYTIHGLTAADADNGYLFSCTAAFNSPNVSEADRLTLSEMKLVTGDGTTIANYSFRSGDTLLIGGYIKPLALQTAWSAETTFPYDAAEHAPTISLVAGQTLPDDSVSVGVTGAQTNAGSYTAYAVISAGEGVDTKNYVITAASCEYTITPRPVTVSPTAATVTYDGEAHTLSGFAVTSGTLAEGHVFTAASDASYTAAGIYTVHATAVALQTSDGHDVTADYEITCGSAVLTISPRPVTFSGVTAANKAYDGNTDAVLNLSGVSFANVAEGDTLSLDPAKIMGSFDLAAVGAREVALAPRADALAGASAANYTLSIDGSQTSADAAITPVALTVTPQSLAVVYGENASFSSAITGYVNGEDESVLKDSASYAIRPAGSTGEFAAYTTATPAGSYELRAVVGGVSADNYTVTAGADAVLTVSPRPLSIVAAAAPTVTKVYDGTTSGAGCVSADDYVLEAVEGNVASGIVNSDSVALKSFTAAFNSADVAAADKVTLTNLVLNNANYKLNETSLEIKASITPRQLTVKAVSQSVVYGSAAAAFTAQYAGFVSGQSADDLSGTLSFSCAYSNTASSENRVVGSYPIAVSGLTSSNYAITFDNTGAVTVTKAVITVTAENLSFIYGESVPTFTCTLSGFRYGETEVSVDPGTVTYSCAVASDSPAGTYPIVPVLTGLSAANYSFAAVNGTLTQTRHEVTIGGITVSDKVYDGNAGVPTANIILDHVTYTGLQSDVDTTKAGVSATGLYADADVGAGKKVTLTVTLNDYLKSRYYIVTTGSQTETTAAIMPRTLTVTANSLTVLYGDAVPTYTVSYSNFASGQSISSGSDVTGTAACVCAYALNSPVATYPITTSGLTSARNYTIVYQDGTLTVAQNRLATPAPAWDAAHPGTVTWTAVPAVGGVSVAGYKVEVLRGGVIVATQTVTETTYNAANDLRVHGAGAYTAHVTAVASETNNADKVNVADSAAGTTKNLYAAKVSFAFSSDGITLAGKVADSNKTNGQADYVAIGGESNIALSAGVVNSTGYTVSSCAADSASASVSGALSGTAYTGTVGLAAALASSADITVTLTLAARPATAVLTLTADPSTAQFSYTEAQAPKVAAAVAPKSDDTLPAADYTYTYVWKLKESAYTDFAVCADQTTASFTFPQSKNAYSNYKVLCAVTATRTDNGQQITVDQTVTIPIAKADLTPTLALSGWTYGEARGVPVVTGNLGNGAVAYFYSTANDDTAAWSAAMPTDAGSYYVKMSIAATENYGQYAMLSGQAVAFTIAKNKLAAPAGLAFDDPMGVASWGAVAGLSENAGTTPASSVTVAYRVELKRDGAAVKTYTVNTPRCDMSGEISSTGSYFFTVTALSSNAANCADSDPSSAKAIVSTNGDITSEGYAGKTYNKTYDGAPITMTVADVLGDVGYQWYKDGKAIDGATGAALSPVDVSDSGLYCCEITGGDGGHSVYRTVSIAQRPLQITASDATQTYTGAALTAKTYSITGGTSLAATDALTTLLYAGSRTDVGTSKNVPSGASILRGTKDVTADYALTYQNGALTVTNAALSEVSAAQTGTLIYTGTAQTASVSASATSVNNQKVTFSYSDSQNGSYTTAIPAFTVTGDHTVYYKVSAPNHDLAAGSFTVTIGKAPLTVTAKDNAITYGQAPAGAGVTFSGFVHGETETALGGALTYTFTYAQYGDVGSYEIMPAGCTAANYAITYKNGVLTVTNAALSEVSAAQTGTLIYTGTAQTASVSASATSVNNQKVTFSYSDSQNGSYTTAIPAFTVTGNHTVYYKVSAPNHDPAAGSFTVTIGKAPLTVTAKDNAITYGEAPAGAGVTFSGFVHGETETALGGALTYTFTYAQYGDVGSYEIMPAGCTAANYAITFAKGALTVGNADLVCTVAQAGALHYTGRTQQARVKATTNAFNGDAVDFVYCDSVDGEYTSAVPGFAEIGEHTVYFKASAKNYNPCSGSFVVTIGEASNWPFGVAASGENGSSSGETSVPSVDTGGVGGSQGAASGASGSSQEGASGSGSAASDGGAEKKDIWRFQGGINQQNLDRMTELDYPEGTGSDEIWCAVMHKEGYEADVGLRVERLDASSDGIGDIGALQLFGAAASPYAGDSQSQLAQRLEGLDWAASFDLSLCRDGAVIDEPSGLYHIYLLLPRDLRDLESLQVICDTEDGRTEVCETGREGDYLVFTSDRLAEFRLLGSRTAGDTGRVINLWWLILLLASLLAAELVALIVALRRRRKDRSGTWVRLRASAAGPALLMAVAVIPTHGVQICIALGILILGAGIALICLRRRR